MADALKPQDLLVALKLAAHPDAPWTYKDLASSLSMSQSEVHQAVKRLERSRLYNSITRRVVRPHLKEFLVHGVAYAFPASEGEESRGIPTAWERGTARWNGRGRAFGGVGVEAGHAARSCHPTALLKRARCRVE